MSYTPIIESNISNITHSTLIGGVMRITYSQDHSAIISRQAFYLAGVKYSSAKILCRQPKLQADFQKRIAHSVFNFTGDDMFLCASLKVTQRKLNPISISSWPLA